MNMLKHQVNSILEQFSGIVMNGIGLIHSRNGLTDFCGLDFCSGLVTKHPPKNQENRSMNVFFIPRTLGSFQPLSVLIISSSFLIFLKFYSFFESFLLYFLRLIIGARVIFKEFFTENLMVLKLSVGFYRLYANLQSLGPQFEFCKVLRCQINRRFQAFLKTYKIQIFILYVFYVFLYVLQKHRYSLDY